MIMVIFESNTKSQTKQERFFSSFRACFVCWLETGILFAHFGRVSSTATKKCSVSKLHLLNVWLLILHVVSSIKNIRVCQYIYFSLSFSCTLVVGWQHGYFPRIWSCYSLRWAMRRARVFVIIICRILFLWPFANNYYSDSLSIFLNGRINDCFVFRWN